jgi:MFS family permease
MIVAQGLISIGVFDRLRPRAVLAAGAVILALGFGLLPFTGAGVAMALSIAAVAASGGILLPLLSYWASLQSAHARGAALGTQSSFASLGQALGSSSAGGLFALAPGAPFWAAALAVATSWLAVSALASPRSVQHVE